MSSTIGAISEKKYDFHSICLCSVPNPAKGNYVFSAIIDNSSKKKKKEKKIARPWKAGYRLSVSIRRTVILSRVLRKWKERWRQKRVKHVHTDVQIKRGWVGAGVAVLFWMHVSVQGNIEMVGLRPPLCRSSGAALNEGPASHLWSALADVWRHSSVNVLPRYFPFWESKNKTRLLLGARFGARYMTNGARIIKEKPTERLLKRFSLLSFFFYHTKKALLQPIGAHIRHRHLHFPPLIPVVRRSAGQKRLNLQQPVSSLRIRLKKQSHARLLINSSDGIQAWRDVDHLFSQHLPC